MQVSILILGIVVGAIIANLLGVFIMSLVRRGQTFAQRFRNQFGVIEFLDGMIIGHTVVGLFILLPVLLAIDFFL